MRIFLGILVAFLVLSFPLGDLDLLAAPAAARHSRARTRATHARRARKRVHRRARKRAHQRRSRRCRRRGDLRVPLKYLQGGAVWIPSEARCGGSYPIIVLLHGNNTARETVKSIGGGRNLDRWTRRYLNGKLIEPVILAEPIHFGACAPAARRKGLPYLFTGRFSFREYRRRLERVLRKHHIRPKSWSFIGHSGAACCLQMGMFAIKKVWPKVKIWASADGCYSGALQATALLHQFEHSHTKIFNACRGRLAYHNYRGYERTLLTRHAKTVRCDSTYYKRCRKHPDRPWYSFATQFTGPEKHSKVLVELFKTVVFHQFPSTRRIAYQKRVAARRRRLAERRRRRARLRRLAALRRRRARRAAHHRRRSASRHAARHVRHSHTAVATRDE